MKDNHIVFACGGLLIFCISVVPLLLLWFNRNAIRTLSRKARRAIAADPTNPSLHNINTSEQTIYTAVFITCTTFLALVMFYFVHRSVAEKIKPISIDWIKSDSLIIKPGPTWFFYDSKAGKLIALHEITEDDKKSLNALLESGDKNYNSYTKAIDELSFRSNISTDNDYYGWVILLYAVSGFIGVQLRTINNFIGIACFKNEFHFHRWWPWYLVRPLLGFISGAVVYLLIEGKQIFSGQLTGGISTVVLALAFLGGFSADDFYELLRKTSKKLFGAA